MKERTRTILETAVRDFIREGRPITSDYLYGRYDFGIKPAMIRWELQELADEGFFYQTRVSGGRFPTRKAYAAYVESIEKNERREKPLLESSRRARGRAVDVTDHEMLPQEVADELNVMGAGYDLRRRVFRECGLTNLIEELGTEARDELLGVVRDVERLEERLVSHLGVWEDDEVWPKVFVGETPLTKTKLLSVLVGKMGSARDPFFVLAVGPLRMDYEKSLALFRTFDEI